MKKLFLSSCLMAGLGASSYGAIVTVGSWNPIFQGVEVASGQQQAQLAGERNHQVMCLRVDLTAPGIELFTTPKCTNCGIYETVSENTSYFLEQYGLQASINGNFYASSTGPTDVPLGTPEDVLGLAISKGVLVSPANMSSYAASMMFTASNQVVFVPTNSVSVDTSTIYTAVSGNYPLLINGVNVQTPNPNDLDPRTAVGVSQDRRYLYMMTLDGRQPGWSDGADFYNTAEWLKRFGAWDAINIDGGGSTTMVTADCSGAAVRLNRSSFVAAYGRERIIGHNFGLRALPLSGGNEVTVAPGATTALVSWTTRFPGTTQVQYGPTTNFGSATPLDSRLVTNHVATLTGLLSGSNYYYRAVSGGANSETFQAGCRFVTARTVQTTEIFGLTKSWTYTTNNLDGVAWKSPSYDDSGWLGQGPGLLYALENNVLVTPKNTVMPPTVAPIPRTYYFRTKFNYSGTTSGVSLTFSNYVDDGAVFYLNGAEVYRLRMPAAPTAILNTTYAIDVPCKGTVQSGEAVTTCPDVFTISGSAVANLVQGENVLAVEAHNYSTSSDLVFGTALLKNSTPVLAPTLNLLLEGGVATLFWNGEGFILQESNDLNEAGGWTDVTGTVNSPYSVTNIPSKFYRLRN